MRTDVSVDCSTEGSYLDLFVSASARLTLAGFWPRIMVAAAKNLVFLVEAPGIELAEEFQESRYRFAPAVRCDGEILST